MPARSNSVLWCCGVQYVTYFDMIVVAIGEATAMRVCGTRERIGSGYGQHAGEKKSEKVTARRGASGCAEMVGSIARVECACQ